MITEEQRLARRSGLFASDVGRGMTGHWVQVALEKLGLQDETDLDDVMEVAIGSKAEKYILDAYESETGATLIRDLDTLIHPDHSWLGCHRDAIDLKAEENIEAKCIGQYNRKQWGDGGDEVPPYVLWQAQTQMACSGHKITKIPVCFVTTTALGLLFLEKSPPITIFEVPKDYELEAHLIDTAKKVWDGILRGETPPPTNLEDVHMLYKKAALTSLEADGSILEAWQALNITKGIIKAKEEEKDNLEFFIKGAMKDAAILALNGVELATWTNNTDGERLDQKKLAKNFPEAYRSCLKNTLGARVFRMKKPKGLL